MPLGVQACRLFGEGLPEANAFKAAVGRAGGTVVVTERYPVQANGMLEPARRLGDQLREAEAGGMPVDALFVPGGSDVLQSIGPLLTYAGVKPDQVKVLGTGCAKCTKLYETTRQAVADLALDAEVEKVSDIQKILAYGVMMTPALVVDGEVKLVGKVPPLDEIKALLG